MKFCVEILMFLVLFGGKLSRGLRQFRRQPANLTVMEGKEKAYMQCSVDDFSGQINWVIKGNVANLQLYPRFSITSTNQRPGEKNLMIKNVDISDDGSYQCSPQGFRSSRIAYLNVTVPPKNVSIQGMNKYGEIVVRSNTRAQFICSSFFSKPAALISWRFGGDEVKATTEITPAANPKLKITSSLATINIKRQMNGSEMKCLVDHPATHYHQEIRAVLIVVYPPDLPSITGTKQVYKEGDIMMVTCFSRGGNPLATLRWFLNDIFIEGNVRHNGNLSTNVLTRKVRAEDHGKKLVCNAENSATSSLLSTYTTFNVLYHPKAVNVTQYPTRISENGSVILKCRVSKSNPKAELKWLLDGKSLPKLARYKVSELSTENDMTVSELRVANVNRNDTLSLYSCSAAVPFLHFVKKRQFRLNISLPTQSVDLCVTQLPSTRLTNCNPAFTQGTVVSAYCVAKGGNPAPTIKWFLNGKQPIDGSTTKSGVGGCGASNAHCSVLKFPLNARHNGAKLSCDAADVGAGTSNKIAEVTLQVQFPPSVPVITQQLFQPIDGQNISLTCTTSSSNPRSNITWWRDGKPFFGLWNASDYTDGENGGYVTNSTIYWTASRSDDEKDVTCRAENNLERTEATHRLNIRFSARINREKTNRKVAKPAKSDLPGVSILSCSAAGDPRPDFQWKKNGNEFSINHENPVEESDVYVSTLRVNVADSFYDDIIRFTCVASNELGEDEMDVLLVPRGPPETPTHLRTSNVSAVSITLRWDAGFDGGASQTFILEFQKSDNSESRWNTSQLSENQKQFTITKLQPDTAYKIRMSSINEYGKSDRTDLLVVKTNHSVTAATSSESTGVNSNYIIIAVVCVLIILLVATFLVFYCRRRKNFHVKGSKTETVSLPTAASSVTGSDVTQDKGYVKFEDMSRVSYTPAAADTLKGNSEYVDLMRSAGRTEVSPSPDSTYSSLNPDERQRENSSDNNSNDLVPTSVLMSGLNRRNDANLPRRVQSALGMNCKSPDTTISYVDFIRRATSTNNHRGDWETPRGQPMNDTSHYVNTNANDPHRAFHTVERVGRKMGVPPSHFRSLEEEDTFRYQMPVDAVREMRVEHQLPDTAYASCDTSMSSIGAHRDPLTIPFSKCGYNSIPYAVSVMNNSPTVPYPQTGLYVLHSNGVDSTSQHSESPVFVKDPNHFVPLQDERSALIKPVGVLTKRSSCTSPSSAVMSEGYPKFLSNHYQQENGQSRHPRNPSLCSSLSSSSHPASVGLQSYDQLLSRERNVANYPDNENESTVAFVGVDQNGTLFV